LSATATHAEMERGFECSGLRAREWVLVCALLVLLCGSWLRGIGRGEVHLMADETRHALNGVFVLDLVRDHPWSWPLQYSFQYYGKYPAIAIGHWPPAFYGVEAAFYWVFGLAPWVSRLAVLPFAILAAVSWYRIVRCHAPPELAWSSTIIYACLPSIFLYQQATMLEIPTLALCLAAIYCWLRTLHTERPAWIYGTAFFSAWALLTKQTALFLGPLFLLHLVVERKWLLLRSKHLYIALTAAGAAVVPWYLTALRLHPTAMSQAIGDLRSVRHPHSFLTELNYYPASLPEELGIPLLILSVVGILLALVSFRNRPAVRLMLIWIASCYLSLSFLADKSPRYIQPWLLPFVFFAVSGVWQLLSRRRALAVTALAGIAAAFYVPSLTYERPYLQGCAEAAHFLAGQPDSDLLFYNGVLNGDFIYQVRKYDPDKRRMVLRERVVNGGAITRALGRPADPPTPADIQEMLLALGVGYAVVDTGGFSKESAQIARALQSDRFVLVKELTVRSNDYRVAGTKLLIYRPKLASLSPLRQVEVPMPSLPHSLRLSISELSGHPWPPRPR
jgi:hypothetical protein